MKNFVIQVIVYSLCSVQGVLAAKDPQICTTIYINASPKQESVTQNQVTATQQLPLSPALLEKIVKNGESFITKNKLLLASIAGAYLYGRTFVAVVQANRALAENTSWASWKSESSLAELKALDQTNLTNQLLHDIQKRYTCTEKLDDALLPFITFLGAIDQEIARINDYRALHFWIETCHATWMFPFNEQRFASASSRLERLWFVKNLFLSWAADYKLASFTARTPCSFGAKLYRYLTEKIGSLWPATTSSTSGTYLADYEKQARSRALLTAFAEAACLAPALVVMHHLLPAHSASYTTNNVVNVNM